VPLFPGFDTLGTLEHIMGTGYEYTWFLLTQKIIEKEFALSGSEQNPDLTNKSVRQLLGVGISGGLIPCPTALVVLLAAISLHRVGYGLVLILAFSIGLATAMTSIGLLAVTAKRAFSRLNFEGGALRLLPAISALVIVGLGLAMTARALPKIV